MSDIRVNITQRKIRVGITQHTIRVNMKGGTNWDGISGKPTPAAESSFMVSNALFKWVVKTLAEVKTLLGLGSAAYTDSDDYAGAEHDHDDLYFTKQEVTDDIALGLAGLVGVAPSTLDTLQELGDALGDDPNFATTMTTALGNKSDVGHTHSQTAITADPFQTPAFANPLELDATTHKDFKCGVITGATTVNLNNTTDGDSGVIELIMNGTGGYAVTLGNMFTKKLGTNSINTLLNKDNFVFWFRDGADIVYTIQTV